MLKKIIALIAVIVILAAAYLFIGGQQNNQQSIKISGAFALYPLMVKWAEEYQKLHPEVRIDVSAGGAGKGMTDVLSGLVDIGMVSRDIDPSEIQKGAFPIKVVKDAVVATMNKNNPAAGGILRMGVRKSQFQDIFLYGNLTTWGTVISNQSITNKIAVYTRSDSCGAADSWAKYLGGKQEDLKGIGVYGDPGLADAVSKDVYGIGYNNLGFAYDPKTGEPLSSLLIIPIDVNGNGLLDPGENFYDKQSGVVAAIVDGRYPSPPARDENIVAKEAFTGASKDFVKWILTDGQQYVGEAGYVSLKDDVLQEQIAKLG
jgi:phosphate transport system substrate-binding protein